ncbi:MAG: DUF5592 family protein [Cetobacterium sp.]|uniref:DUF5592 family protein n=1 Tax=Bacteria TaxID=2 RepID=UPI002FC7A2AE
MQYNIPKEISSEMKFTKSIYLFDIAILVIGLAIAWSFNSLVYSKLLFFYYGYVIFGIAFLVAKSKLNPKKRNFESIYLCIIRNRTTYIRDSKQSE